MNIILHNCIAVSLPKMTPQAHSDDSYQPQGTKLDCHKYCASHLCLFLSIFFEIVLVNE